METINYKEDYKETLLTLFEKQRPRVLNAVLLNAGNRSNQKGTKTYALFIADGSYMRGVTYEVGKLLALNVVHSEMRNTGILMPYDASILDIGHKLAFLLYGTYGGIEVYLQPLPYEE